MPQEKTLKTFASYSHDVIFHKQIVLAVANQLRAHMSVLIKVLHLLTLIFYYCCAFG